MTLWWEKETFWCWDAFSLHEESAEMLSYPSAGAAAEDYARSRWSDNDHAKEQHVMVRDSGGTTQRFLVEAEASVTFAARLACPECGTPLVGDGKGCVRAECIEMDREVARHAEALRRAVDELPK